MASKKQTLALVRNCFRELKYLEEMKTGSLEHLVWQKSPIYKHIRKISKTDSSILTNLQSYITLLHGSRRSQELIAKYKGVGERSIEETAKIVGLKLPKLYVDKIDN